MRDESGRVGPDVEEQHPEVVLGRRRVLQVEHEQVPDDEDGVEGKNGGHGEAGPQPVLDQAEALRQRPQRVDGRVDGNDGGVEHDGLTEHGRDQLVDESSVILVPLEVDDPDDEGQGDEAPDHRGQQEQGFGSLRLVHVDEDDVAAETLVVAHTKLIE